MVPPSLECSRLIVNIGRCSKAMAGLLDILCVQGGCAPQCVTIQKGGRA